MRHFALEQNVQEATFDLGTLDPIEVNVVAASKEVRPDRVYFSIIAGSFRSIENAEKVVKDPKIPMIKKYLRIHEVNQVNTHLFENMLPPINDYF